MRPNAATTRRAQDALGFHATRMCYRQWQNDCTPRKPFEARDALARTETTKLKTNKRRPPSKVDDESSTRSKLPPTPTRTHAIRSQSSNRRTTKRSREEADKALDIRKISRTTIATASSTTLTPMSTTLLVLLLLLLLLLRLQVPPDPALRPLLRTCTFSAPKSRC